MNFLYHHRRILKINGKELSALFCSFSISVFHFYFFQEYFLFLLSFSIFYLCLFSNYFFCLSFYRYLSFFSVSISFKCPTGLFTKNETGKTTKKLFLSDNSQIVFSLHCRFMASFLIWH